MLPLGLSGVRVSKVKDYLGRITLGRNCQLALDYHRISRRLTFFDRTTGIATSAKTLDTTTAAKIANPSQIYSSLKGNIDSAAGFAEYSLKDVTVSSSQITRRELQVAVPKATTSAQWDQINRAIEYGQGKGVTVRITRVD